MTAGEARTSAIRAQSQAKLSGSNEPGETNGSQQSAQGSRSCELRRGTVAFSNGSCPAIGAKRPMGPPPTWSSVMERRYSFFNRDGTGLVMRRRQQCPQGPPDQQTATGPWPPLDIATVNAESQAGETEGPQEQQRFQSNQQLPSRTSQLTCFVDGLTLLATKRRKRGRLRPITLLKAALICSTSRPPRPSKRNPPAQCNGRPVAT